MAAQVAPHLDLGVEHTGDLTILDARARLHPSRDASSRPLHPDSTCENPRE